MSPKICCYQCCNCGIKLNANRIIAKVSRYLYHFWHFGLTYLYQYWDRYSLTCRFRTVRSWSDWCPMWVSLVFVGWSKVLGRKNIFNGELLDRWSPFRLSPTGSRAHPPEFLNWHWEVSFQGKTMISRWSGINSRVAHRLVVAAKVNGGCVVVIKSCENYLHQFWCR